MGEIQARNSFSETRAQLRRCKTMHGTMKFRVGWLIASTRCIWRCIYTHQSIYTRSHLQWPDYTACYLPPWINAPSIRCTLPCIHPYTHVRLGHARSAPLPVSLTSTTHRRLINSTIPKTVLCDSPIITRLPPLRPQ